MNQATEDMINAALELGGAQADSMGSMDGSIGPAWWTTITDVEILQNLISGLIRSQSLPEAPGVSFTNMYLPGNPTPVGVTCRGVSGQAALDALMSTIKHAQEAYGMSFMPNTIPSGPQHQPASAPSPAPVTQRPVSAAPAQHANQGGVPKWYNPQTSEEHEVVQALRVQHQVGQGGQHFIRVFTGKPYEKFGLPLYENFMSEELKEEYGLWPINQDMPIPSNLRFVVTDKLAGATAPDGKAIYAKKIIAYTG